MATLQDIAKQAGVSPTTVSLTLAGKGRISQSMRDRIFTIAKELGYKKLYLQQPSNIRPAVILLPIYSTWGHVWYFIKDIIEIVQIRMQEQGYESIILPIQPEHSVGENLEAVKNLNASAVFSIHYGNTDLFTSLEVSGIPLVMINNSEYQSNFYSVCVDNFQGSYEGTSYLIEEGHNRIAYFDYPRPTLPNTFTDRFMGFQKAMEENNIQLPPDWRITAALDNPRELGRRIRKLMDSKDAPTAVFVHDDFQANRVYHLLTSFGYKVPQEISLIAAGDTLDYRQPETPSISTMKINTQLMAEYATDMMKNRLEKREVFRDHHSLKLRPTLKIRNSIAQLSPKNIDSAPERDTI